MPSTQRQDVGKKTMLAVLPFENLGPPDDEYFADGITDAITARLACIHGLGVISRQSAMQYKKSEKSIKQIGEELGVDYILEGTVQRERPTDPTSRVRIIPQLVKVADDTHMWAETYDDEMSEVFRVQSSVAEQVALKLEISLLESERWVLKRKQTDNIEAYEHFLRGKDYASQRKDIESSRAAIRLFEKAVVLDPRFAEAWAALAKSYTWLFYSWSDPDTLSKIEFAAGKALELGPELPETQLALGYISYYVKREYEKALTHFVEAQRRRPSDAEATEAIGLILKRQGKWEESLDHMQRALELDPGRFAFIEDEMGWAYLWLRRYEEADHRFTRVISLAPDMGHSYVSKALLYIIWKGDVNQARHILQEIIRLMGVEETWKIMSGWLTFTRIMANAGEDLFDRISPQNLTSLEETGLYYIMKAELTILRNQREQAVAYYDSARVSFESAIQTMPYPFFLPDMYSCLGLAYAGLGQNERAITEGEKAVELIPVSEDAIWGPLLLEQLAQIYVKIGEYEAALEQLEILLSIPSECSVPVLRLDPIWDPLRDNPRFKQLLDKYSGDSS
jgi:serine/threonine-protein kinase